MRKESKSNDPEEKSETTRSNRSNFRFDSSISRVKGGLQTNDDGNTDITTTTRKMGDNSDQNKGICEKTERETKTNENFENRPNFSFFHYCLTS